MDPPKANDGLLFHWQPDEWQAQRMISQDWYNITIVRYSGIIKPLQTANTKNMDGAGGNRQEKYFACV
jgi:hypothetical protein